MRLMSLIMSLCCVIKKRERESYTSALSPTAGNTMKGFLLKFWDTIRQQLAVPFTHRVNLTITFGFSGKAE